MLATVDEINYLQGLDENIMDKLSKVVNGGLTIYKDKSFNNVPTTNVSIFPLSLVMISYCLLNII